jgi:hypothetical protein
MKMRYEILVAVSALLLANCKLDKPDISSAAGTTVGPVDTTGNADSYQPTGKGYYWAYHQTSDQGSPSDELTTLTGATATFNGKTYDAATDKLDTASGTIYFYHANNDYSIRSNVIGTGFVVEYLYLKDNIAEGQTWTAPVTDYGTLAGFPAHVIGQVVKRDTTMIVASTTFKNVAHSQLLLQYNVTGAFETYQVIDFYVAKGVGIIEIDTEVKQPGILKTQKLLTSYKVKN